jgi:protein-tyrosine-phosphatase
MLHLGDRKSIFEKDRTQMGSILFVCTANICRSPMAAALFQDLLKKQPGGSQWRIESAGTWTYNGQPACDGAQNAMRSRGLDISSHRSREVTAALLESFDLILTMEKSHEEALQIDFPQVAEKVFQLREALGAYGDIEDPYGGQQEEYDAAAEELSVLLEQGLEKIIKLTRE